jgi:hypothetical protein
VSKIKEALACTIPPQVLYETAQKSVLLRHAVLKSDYL